MKFSARNRASSMGCPAKMKGFSLIEVLVAVLVLSIGLLGGAGLQIFSLKSIKVAELNTQASLQAYDIVDRMRANMIAVAGGVYGSAKPKRISGCTNQAGCSTSEMAENDLFEWMEAISEQLPGGEAGVCIDSTPEDGSRTSSQCDGIGHIYAIKLWWLGDDKKDERYVVTYAP